ncbi:perlucin-like [Dreissena polymorpha]|uniref:C-type lectin domain-containing protein n=1 Tax=Dreissena polymorpha TaxID=45954 RepID=A0A9D4E2M9_DREPO|nr:perlucin-like [Dreissena polymorpha]KAH3772662.1 hypothetical protein DPMN_174004 [Dreissena polymorpha]
MKAIFLLAFFITFQGSYGCDNGWISFNGHCYHFSTDLESWIGAEGVCIHFGSYLAEIDDHAEDMFMQNWVNILAKVFWVGGTDLGFEGDWTWAYSKKHLYNGYTRWQRNEPSNSGGSEHCLNLWRYTDWNDWPCWQVTNFICEKNGP